MLLRALGTDGSFNGNRLFELSENPVLGSVKITADGSNDATVVVRKDSSTGDIIFKMVTKSPMSITEPIQAASTIWCSCTGTGAAAQFFEWVE